MKTSKARSATNADHRRRPESDSRLFSDGEKVLAYHKDRLYEAKVLKAEIATKKWKYFIHYLGWSKTWDEWVHADRLMEYTDENTLQQKAFNAKQGVDKNPESRRSTQSEPKTSRDVRVDKEVGKSKGPKGKKRKNNSSTEDSASIEKPMKIQIPAALKKQLVDDWDFVKNQNKLLKLPRSPNVDGILRMYLEYRSKKVGMMTDAVAEILKGIRCYFDRALPVILLYNKERQQYNESAVNNISPSSVYGAEHLLRLFVKLPELFSYVNIAEDLVTRMQPILVDFLRFINKNQSSFLMCAYTVSQVSDETSLAWSNESGVVEM